MTFRFDHSTSFPKAEKIVDRSGGDDSRDLLSINQSKCQVVWYGALGCKVHCRFTFQSCPIDAKFCQFKANNSERKLGTHEDDSGSLVKRAIAILLDNGDLQIRLFSGEVHELTLPYQIKRLLSISNGLLLERRVSEEEGALKCLWMANPLSPLTVVESNERVISSDLLCVYEGWLCSYSRAENSVSVLALQALAAGSLGAADDNINRSNLSNAVSPSPYNSRSRSETPNVLLDLSRADKTNQQYRSPMVYSRESSLEFEFSRDPAHPERKSPTAAASAILSSTLYGHHPGSDAALRSLLTPANLQARSSRSGAVPVTQQRAGGLTGTSGLMSSIRSQPLLYSCGTSGGSSNSNSAYHIRKKRAAQGGIPSHSPVPSPRPSPSSFLFDSSVRVDSFGAMAMDVDLSPAAFRTRDSPQDLSNHSYQNLHDLSANGEIRGTGGASFSDTSNAELSGPPEVYLTCVARVKLPTSPLPHPGSQLSASFSGGFDMVGGLCLNIFNSTPGIYMSYRVYEESDELENAGEGKEDSVFFPATADCPCNQLPYTLELKYTNAPPTECTTATGDGRVGGASNSVSIPRFLGVAHISTSLESDGQATLRALGISTAALPPVLRSTQKVPLTLLLTVQGRVQVLIGAQAVQEVPLAWQDDLAELSDAIASAPDAQSVIAMQTIHASGTHFVVHSQDTAHVLTLLPLLESASSSPSYVRVPAQILREVINASIAMLRLMNTEGLIECVLGFLINVHAEIGSLWTLSWLLAAAFGVPYDLFVLTFSNVKSQSHRSPQQQQAQQSQQVAAYLRQIYQVFATDAVRLYQASSDHCIGAELFSAAHAVLQDRHLRGDEVDISGLKDVLQSSVRLVSQYQASSSIELPLKSAYNSLLFTYGEYYNDNHSYFRPTLDAVAWCKESIKGLSSGSQSNQSSLVEFPLPPLDGTHTLQPCPTIRLTSRFLEYLDRSTSKNSCHPHDTTAASAPARTALDAYVFAVHGEIAAADSNRNSSITTDWAVTTAYFPCTLRRILDLAVEQCQANPNPAWPQYLLKLIKRRDLCSVSGNKVELLNLKKSAEMAQAPAVSTKAAAAAVASAKGSKTEGAQAPESDGLLEVEKASLLRFTEDDRVHEICRMLRSSQPSYLKFEKPPEVSELDHRHKLQMKLLSLVRRVLANPVGRGMLTIASLEPLMAEALPIPPLCLAGRVPPANSILQFDASTAHLDLTLWPDFHNGVAAALRVGPAGGGNYSGGGSGGGGAGGLERRSKITRNWIMYNRTASIGKPGGDASHAGFLLGLGLWGHLTNLSVSDTYDYLVQGHEPTTVAVLIGTAASKIGSADPLHLKTLSLHLPPLLPAQHGEIEISPSVQAAALVSLGLLHCASGHRLMTEFLLAELSRSPMSDRCECRESMVTSAAWALGMVLLGKGKKVTESHKTPAVSGIVPATPTHKGSTGAPTTSSATTGNSGADDAMKGLADLRVESRLLQFIDGGKRPGESALFPVYTTTDVSSRSSRMLEGADINTNVTSPGAIIALALIYIRSNDPDILERLAVPTTVIALDAIRPDLLIYRALAACLIKWDKVTPTAEWVRVQIPEAILSVVSPAEASKHSGGGDAKADFKLLYQKANKKLDGRTALALYLNICSGYCYGIGVVFAGTANEQAKQTILETLKLLQSLRDNKPLLKLPFTLDKSLRQSVETCICLVSLSLSCVMAGSGDLDCLRTLRELRWKVEDVTYGTHMSLSMAIGMLFLGGGNYSLRRDPLSAACLLLSLCPRFPFRTVDHQYHMQALRHLYVLAAEPRALHTIDVDTGLTVSVRVQVELVDGSRFSMVAPGLLPELASIRRISVVNAPDDNDNVNADGGSAPLVQYYPTSIVMQGETKQKSDEINVQVDDCCHQSVEEILRSTKSSVLRGSHQHTAVPPLFVKRIPVVVYSSPSSCTSSSDRRGGVAEGAVVHCAQSLLAQALQQAALPRAFSNADNLSAEFVRRNEVSVVRTKELLAGLRGGKASADNGISSAMMENDLFAAIVLGAVSANS